MTLPRQNEEHFKRDVGGDVRRRIKVHCVRRVDELLDLVLLPAGAGKPVRGLVDKAIMQVHPRFCGAVCKLLKLGQLLALPRLVPHPLPRLSSVDSLLIGLPRFVPA